MNWFLQALKKYADFSGRARRKEYWFFILFYLIILIVLMIIDGFVGTQIGGAGFGILTCIYALGMLIPALAVTVMLGFCGWALARAHAAGNGKRLVVVVGGLLAACGPGP